MRDKDEEGRNKEKMGRGRSKEEGEKFECRFEEIGKKGIMTEIGKRVVKIFLIFERELYTFVIIGMTWRMVERRRGYWEIVRRMVVIIV